MEKTVKGKPRVKLRNVSIRTALYLAVILSLLPALVIMIAGGFEHGRLLEDKAKLEVMRQAEAFAEIQTRITESTRQILSTLASLPAFAEGDWKHASDILKAVHENNPDYLNFTAVDSSGRVAVSSLLDPGTDLTDRPHIKDNLGTGKFGTGEYVVGLIGATPAFAYTCPVPENKGESRGIIATLYKLSSYDRLFESFNLPEDSFLGLIDKQGVRLYFYPPRKQTP